MSKIGLIFGQVAISYFEVVHVGDDVVFEFDFAVAAAGAGGRAQRLGVRHAAAEGGAAGWALLALVAVRRHPRAAASGVVDPRRAVRTRRRPLVRDARSS